MLRVGSVVPARELAPGFVHRGRRFAFRSQQGIFRPRGMVGGAVSITTVVDGPYDDGVGSEAGSFLYRYRGNGPNSFDNRILREAFRLQAPVVYFYGIDRGLYSPLWPCYITRDDRAAGLVHVEMGVAAVDLAAASGLHSSEVERRYAMRLVKTRSRPRRAGRARRGHVPNGLSLCAIHHEAYDRDLLGISPDLRVRLSRRLLDDDDGPMLEWGLKAFHDARITLPRRAEDHPSRENLDERFRRFERAA